MATEELAACIVAARLREVALLNMTSEASLERPVFRTVPAPGREAAQL